MRATPSTSRGLPGASAPATINAASAATFSTTRTLRTRLPGFTPKKLMIESRTTAAMATGTAAMSGRPTRRSA